MNIRVIHSKARIFDGKLTTLKLLISAALGVFLFVKIKNQEIRAVQAFRAKIMSEIYAENLAASAWKNPMEF